MQLLYQIKKHDRLGMEKLVTQFSQRNTLKSPLALVLLVRYTAKLLNDEVAEGRMQGTSFQNGSNFARSGYAFLEASLRHKSEMVVYEAAKSGELLARCHSRRSRRRSHPKFSRHSGQETYVEFNGSRLCFFCRQMFVKFSDYRRIFVDFSDFRRNIVRFPANFRIFFKFSSRFPLTLSFEF